MAELEAIFDYMQWYLRLIERESNKELDEIVAKGKNSTKKDDKRYWKIEFEIAENREISEDVKKAQELTKELERFGGIRSMELDYLNQVCQKYGMKDLQKSIKGIIDEYSENYDVKRNELQELINKRSFRKIPSGTTYKENPQDKVEYETSLEKFRRRPSRTIIPGYQDIFDDFTFQYQSKVHAKYMKGKFPFEVTKDQIKENKVEITSVSLFGKFGSFSKMAEIVMKVSDFREMEENYRRMFPREFEKEGVHNFYDLFVLQTEAVKLIEKYNKKYNDISIKIELIKDIQMVLDKEPKTLKGLKRTEELARMREDLEMKQQEAVNQFTKRYGQKIDKIMQEVAKKQESVRIMQSVKERYNKTIDRLLERDIYAVDSYTKREDVVAEKQPTEAQKDSPKERGEKREREEEDRERA